MQPGGTAPGQAVGSGVTASAIGHIAPAYRVVLGFTMAPQCSYALMYARCARAASILTSSKHRVHPTKHRDAPLLVALHTMPGRRTATPLRKATTHRLITEKPLKPPPPHPPLRNRRASCLRRVPGYAVIHRCTRCLQGGDHTGRCGQLARLHTAPTESSAPPGGRARVEGGGAGGGGCTVVGSGCGRHQ